MLLVTTASLEPKRPLLPPDPAVGLVQPANTVLLALLSPSPAQMAPGLLPQLKAPVQLVPPGNLAAEELETNNSSSPAIIIGTVPSHRTPPIHMVDSVQQVPICSLMQEAQPLQVAVFLALLESTALLAELLVTALRAIYAARVLHRRRQQEPLRAQPTHAQSATTALRAQRVQRGA